MENKKPYLHYIFFILIAISITSGCSISKPTQILPTETQITTAINIIPKPIKTVPPDFSPEPKSTVTVDVTPTLDPSEALAKVLTLLESNGGCQLPCFWGIEPGKSSWEDVQINLLTFTSRTYGLETIKPPDFTGSVELFYSVPEELSYRNEIDLRLYVDRNIIALIDAYPLQSEAFSIEILMKEVGQPSEIWISTWRSYPGGMPPFVFIAYFRQTGMIISNSVEVNFKDRMISACLQPSRTMLLFEPSADLSFSDAMLKFMHVVSDFPYKRIEEATGIDEYTFFEMYVDSENQICIETPRDIWPDG